MKRFLLLLLLLAPLAAVAQEDYGDYYARKASRAERAKTHIDLGLTAGAGWYGFDSSVELYDVEGGLGWQAGLHAAFMWNSLGVRFEVDYARHKVDMKPNGNYPEVNMHYNKVEVPVLFVWNPSIFRLHFGPVFRVMNDCQHTMADGKLADFGMLRSTVGFAVGGGLQLGRHWIIEVRYNGDFAAAEGVFYDGGPEVSIREHAVQLNLGFTF